MKSGTVGQLHLDRNEIGRFQSVTRFSIEQAESTQIQTRNPMTGSLNLRSSHTRLASCRAGECLAQRQCSQYADALHTDSRARYKIVLSGEGNRSPEQNWYQKMQSDVLPTQTKDTRLRY